MEVLNSNNFPFKPNERDYSSHFSIVTDYYKKAIKYAEVTLKSQGFLTYASIGVVGEKNNPVIITNLLARNLLTDDEVSCILCFPRRQQSSTKNLIIRINKMKNYWKRMSLFLCFSKGTGEFKIISRRIYAETKNNLKIYSLNLNNGEIRELWRNNVNGQTEEETEEAEK